MKDVKRDGLQLSRRSAMGLMGSGMFALMANACGQPAYEVEPQVLSTPQPEVKTNYYEVKALPGEQITDRSGVEPRLMYVNPVAAKNLLDSSVVLYRDFYVPRWVRTGGTLSDTKKVDFPNRQMVVLPAETTRVIDPSLYRVMVANSRGNLNIGKNRVYNLKNATVEQVFHSDQIALGDRGRQVFVFDIEVESVGYNGVTEEGQNVLRVLNNDHQIIFEMKNSLSGFADRKDVYRLKVTK